MKILSINVRGCKKRRKQLWVKDLCSKYSIMFLGIQETKMARLEPFRLKVMWGNFNYDFACSLSRGRSGGIISLWDPNVFLKDQIWCGDNYVIIKGKWTRAVGTFFIINIYGPQDHGEKIRLWNFLATFKENHEGYYIIFGDFNEVREEADRFGTQYNSLGAHHFNSFINNVGLIDVPLCGRRFT
ncbi:uncharacterized protein [Rutidosis leptorrhynchoides]|uniref:uncharacterized protein n=1 Tax=Rutidosis leptorrhynchoides TaxID=125765 RepID=UPI003A9A0D31